MEKVPNAAYKIIGLDIIGLPRKFNFQVFSFFFKLFKSLIQANKIINKFKPDICIGVGGYASGATLAIANLKSIPIVLQEQNSYAGLTNKLLGKKAKKICVSYDGMESFFPKEKIIKTGNPVRKNLLTLKSKNKLALEFWKIDLSKKVILVLGGSGGAKQINESIIFHLDTILKQKDIFMIWQTGKFYLPKIKENLKNKTLTNIKIVDFITEMNFAYSVADVIISRAGAGTIAELSIIGKASVLVPSPNVAEDHQTKNAIALVQKKASILVKDKDAKEQLIPTTLSLLSNKDKMKSLSKNISEMAFINASDKIADEILNIKA